MQAVFLRLCVCYPLSFAFNFHSRGSGDTRLYSHAYTQRHTYITAAAAAAEYQEKADRFIGRVRALHTIRSVHSLHIHTLFCVRFAFIVFFLPACLPLCMPVCSCATQKRNQRITIYARIQLRWKKECNNTLSFRSLARSLCECMRFFHCCNKN